jgi:single-strand DNA-binding protein
MASLNKVLLIGNLTRDPDVRYTPKGTAVADVSMAINRVWTNDSGQRQEETIFVDVTLWGRQAEIAQQYLHKGRPLFVEGRLQMDTWEDKQTGQKRSKLKIVAENIQLLGPRENGGAQRDSSGSDNESSTRRGSAQNRSQSTQRHQPQPPADADDAPLSEDDIPF